MLAILRALTVVAEPMRKTAAESLPLDEKDTAPEPWRATGCLYRWGAFKKGCRALW